MAQHTAYQYAKLGSNLEYLRGICTISLMQTTSLVAFPRLMENLPPTRYAVPQVVGVLRSLLVQLEEMKLEKSLEAAGHFRPMLQEMEQYLAQTATPESSFLNDQFADRLVEIARYLTQVLKQELAAMPA